MKKLSILIITLLIIQATAISQSCLPEGITFTTQSQIDSFQINYPNCTEIEGDVIITDYNSGDITNLNGLNVLTSIGGNLEIGDYYLSNPSLPNLTGLDNVTSIGGDLTILINFGITSLTGLEGLTSVAGDIEISGCYSLTSLSALGNLTSIGGSIEIRETSVSSLLGLEGLTSINGNLILNSNMLSTLSGLDNLTSVGGDLFIEGNPFLSSLTGLDNVISIGEGLFIGVNEALANLTGLENLTSSGSVYIYTNEVLTSMMGIENLITIGGHLTIENNNALSSLTGMTGLTSIDGNLAVGGNSLLISLTGLDNIDAGSIVHLHIQYNDLLSTCEVSSICNYLVNPNGSIYINDNGPGCNSKTEVEEACGIISVENISFEEEVSIYPNPANQEVFVSCNNGTKITEATIYNQIGQKVLHHKPVTQPIDVSMLQPGRYIIEVNSQDLKIREKLIIR